MREKESLKGHVDDLVFEPVVVADHEPAFAEFRIPLDAMKQVLNWNHGQQLMKSIRAEGQGCKANARSVIDRSPYLKRKTRHSKSVDVIACR